MSATNKHTTHLCGRCGCDVWEAHSYCRDCWAVDPAFCRAVAS